MSSLTNVKPIVQKYGGTSVGSVDRIKNIAKRIKGQVAAGESKIAVVVSAMSGETSRIVDLVRQINPDAPPHHYDMAVSAGEQVSVALLAAALEGEGVEAKGFTAYHLGIHTDGLHAKARINSIDCAKLNQAWEMGQIPVITGFQGVSPDGEITTLGRGGSDTSAVALAVALGASVCEINTDVDGVFTADPRIVPKARPNRLMDFEVTLEMAALGSKVLHARCVELAAKYNMPIIVRNTFKHDETEGTRIMSLSENQKLEAPVVSGVTLEREVVRVALDGLSPEPRVIPDLFQAIADAGVNVDIIVHNRSDDNKRTRIGFSIGEDDLKKTLDTLKGVKSTLGLSDLQIKHERGLAKVSIVGLGMQSNPGVASRCFSTLAKSEVEIHMISTSEIKVSCLVSEGIAEKACNALHDEFIR